jgi:hypothetical protein
LPLRCSRILTEQDEVISHKSVWWNPQVCRRRDTFEYTAGQIEFRTVTWTEKPAAPILVRANLEILKRRAAQMGARTLNDEVLGFHRTVLVGRVRRLLLNNL